MAVFRSGKRAARKNAHPDRTNAIPLGRRQQLTKIVARVAGRDRFTGGRNKQIIKNLGTVEDAGRDQHMQVVGITLCGKSKITCLASIPRPLEGGHWQRLRGRRWNLWRERSLLTLASRTRRRMRSSWRTSRIHLLFVKQKQRP